MIDPWIFALAPAALGGFFVGRVSVADPLPKLEPVKFDSTTSPEEAEAAHVQLVALVKHKAQLFSEGKKTSGHIDREIERLHPAARRHKAS